MIGPGPVRIRECAKTMHVKTRVFSTSEAAQVDLDVGVEWPSLLCFVASDRVASLDVAELL